jgi:hypothetical protein
MRLATVVDSVVGACVVWCPLTAVAPVVRPPVGRLATVDSVVGAFGAQGVVWCPLTAAPVVVPPPVAAFPR